MKGSRSLSRKVNLPDSLLACRQVIADIYLGILAFIHSCIYDGTLQDACLIIEQAQQTAYSAVNEMLIKRNWLLGLRIHHEVLNEQRAEYGEQVISKLAEKLTQKYGKGYIKRNLWYFIDFYVKHPDFFHAAGEKTEIVNALSSQSSSHDNQIVNALSSQSEMAEIFQSLTGNLP